MCNLLSIYCIERNFVKTYVLISRSTLTFWLDITFCTYFFFIIFEFSGSDDGCYTVVDAGEYHI